MAQNEPIVLKLRNGDRLTGTLLSETDDTVVISTTWAPTLTIPKADIALRETPAQAVEPKPAPAPATNVVAKPKPAPAPAPKAASPPAAAKKKLKNWSGDAQVGTDLAIGERNRQLYSGRVKLTYAPGDDKSSFTSRTPIERFRTTLDVNGAYGIAEREVRQAGREPRKENFVSANRVDGISKTDFELGERLFVYNQLGAGYDLIRKIEFRYEAGPGVGYRVLKGTNYALNAEIGLNYQMQYFTNDTSIERFYYRLAQDFSWRIAKKLTFDEKLEFFPQADDLSNYRVRFESNLRYWLLENLTFNLTLINLYDTDPARNVNRNDLQIRSSIGVKF